MEHADDTTQQNDFKGVNLTIEQLARLTNVDATKVKTLLTTKDAETGESLNQEQQFSIISSLMSDHFKMVREQQRARGGKEFLSSKQKKLAEKYGVEPNGTIDDVVERIESKIKLESSEISPDEAFKIKAVQEKIENYKKLLGEKDSEIQSIKTNFHKEKVFGAVRKHALSILEAEKAMFSSDPNIKQRQLEAFYSKLSAYEYKQEGENYIPLDKEGNPLEDGYKNLSFKDHVLNNSIFEYGDRYEGKGTSKGPNMNHSQQASKFTEQQLKNYGNVYADLLSKGRHDEAEEILKAGKAYHDAKQDE